VETTAEDINSSGRFQGTPGLEPPRAIFAFYSPFKIVLRWAEFVKIFQLYRLESDLLKVK
jgi:hypothetical protein